MQAGRSRIPDRAEDAGGDAFGASCGMGAGAAHTDSTGLQETCCEAATSAGLCPFHGEIYSKSCCVCPHAQAVEFAPHPTDSDAITVSTVLFSQSFLSQYLTFPGDFMSFPPCRSRGALQGGMSHTWALISHVWSQFFSVPCQSPAPFALVLAGDSPLNVPISFLFHSPHTSSFLPCLIDT